LKKKKKKKKKERKKNRFTGKKKKIIKRGQVAHIILALCWLLILVIDPSFGMWYCFKTMFILAHSWPHIFLVPVVLFQTQAHFSSLLAFIFGS
jgi:hypothetical protein